MGAVRGFWARLPGWAKGLIGLVIVILLGVLAWWITGSTNLLAGWGSNKAITTDKTAEAKNQLFVVTVPSGSVEDYRSLGIITKQNGKEVIDLAAFTKQITKETQMTDADFIKLLATALTKAQNGETDTDGLRAAFNYLVWQGFSSDPELKKLLVSATPAKTAKPVAVTRSAKKHTKKVVVVAQKPKPKIVFSDKVFIGPPPSLLSPTPDKVVKLMPDKVDKVVPKAGEVQVIEKNPAGAVTTYRVIPPKKIRIITKITPIISKDDSGGGE